MQKITLNDMSQNKTANGKVKNSISHYLQESLSPEQLQPQEQEEELNALP